MSVINRILKFRILFFAGQRNNESDNNVQLYPLPYTQDFLPYQIYCVSGHYSTIGNIPESRTHYFVLIVSFACNFLVLDI